MPDAVGKGQGSVQSEGEKIRRLLGLGLDECPTRSLGAWV